MATILSAQCTDRRVNQVTEKLFPRYPTVESMAALTPEELEPQIRECGLYRNKAKKHHRRLPAPSPRNTAAKCPPRARN